jgi:uncharacterized membrane protein YfcA
MTLLVFLLTAFALSILAGTVGAMLGLGGGIIVVPTLTLLLGIDIRFAIGASIVSVIATSSGAAATYLRDDVSNLRVGMYLEIATAAGALAGAFVGGLIDPRWLHLLFSIVLVGGALAMWRHNEAKDEVAVTDPIADRLRLHGHLRERDGRVIEYRVRRSRTGLAISGAAGLVSGLLGIGGGIIKVPTMHMLMGLPMRAATATSNLMIGVTAAASAGVYFARGEIDPFVAAPVIVGVVIGARIGAKLLPRVRGTHLRWAFTAVLLIIAAQMLRKGIA